MNIFYAPPAQIFEDSLELIGQEAKHASKTLRYKHGDEITAVDGKGGWFEGKVTQITPQKVIVEITLQKKAASELPAVTAAIGLIKKKDRLEFAVEKAVELGAGEIAVFRGEHSVKQNVRMDRLDTLAVSAMKQSLRATLPGISSFDSLRDLIHHYSSYKILAAHKSGKKLATAKFKSLKKEFLLLTGPEGDFSEQELKLLKNENAQLISLGKNRLRTETAAILFLNSFLSLHKGL